MSQSMGDYISVTYSKLNKNSVIKISVRIPNIY